MAPAKSIQSLDSSKPKGVIKDGRVKAVARTSGTGAKVDTRERSITYKGNTYLSVGKLIANTGSKVSEEEFKRRYNIGYSLDECLGFARMRPEEQVTPRSKQKKMVDSIKVEIN